MKEERLDLLQVQALCLRQGDEEEDEEQEAQEAVERECACHLVELDLLINI